jgi:hypothetical protein
MAACSVDTDFISLAALVVPTIALAWTATAGKSKSSTFMTLAPYIV